MKSIAIISTGGTIEKTYDELDGILENGLSVLDTMLASLVFDGVNLHRVAFMNKDSREMEYADHDRIADEAAGSAAAHDGSASGSVRIILGPVCKRSVRSPRNRRAEDRAPGQWCCPIPTGS